ncbi:MAG: glycerol-3-phosphate dehydrogenase [Thermomicrobiales bacterium]|nr:glycerol-3-phosphate dehydrogenase [Thermomicrobiales bacterium]
MTDRFDDNRYDLIVIGAGINGAAIARDAATRGMSVLVLEKRDIASGTTSWATRLIHGGLRYLEHAEIGLVRESLRERERLLRNAPHLVDPLPLILPIYDGAKRGPLMIRIGMTLYDILSYDKSLDRHRLLDRAETLRRLPGLDDQGLKAGARYYDAQVTFPERLTVELMLSAIQHGVRLKTYTDVTRIVTDGNIVEGVEATDLRTRETRLYRGRTVINVTGPWVDETLLGAPADRRPERQMGGTKGTHLVVRAFEAAPNEALYVEARSDGRAFFIVPWNGQWLIGTTDTRYDGDLDDVHATPDEIDYLLRETNQLFPAANLTVEDVAFTYAGVRPLPYTQGGSAGAITRRHIVKSHAPRLTGLWSVIGGKLTTHRELAEAAVDDICEALGNEEKCRTRDMPLPGAAGIVPSAFTASFVRDNDLPAKSARRLATLYGAMAEEVVRPISFERELGEVFDEESGAIAAEIVYAITVEQATTLEDILMRRTMLGLRPGMALEIAERVAQTAAPYLDWTEEQTRAQIEAYQTHTAPFLAHLRMD